MAANQCPAEAKSRTQRRGRRLGIYGVDLRTPVASGMFGIELKVRRRADARRRAVVDGNQLGRLPLAAGAEAATDAHLGTAPGRSLHI